MKTGPLKTVNGDVLRTVRVAVKEVLNVRRHLKIVKSPRHEQIYLRTLGEDRKENAGILAKIYKSSLGAGEVS